MLNFFITVLLAVHVLVSLLIILVTLMQRPKSEGLGAAFGGGMTENIFGAQTTNVLANFTRWMGGIFFAVTLLLSILYARQSAATSSAIREKLLNAPKPPAATPTPKTEKSPAATPATKTEAPPAEKSAAPPAMKTGESKPEQKPAEHPKSSEENVKPAATPAPAPVVPKTSAPPDLQPAAQPPAEKPAQPANQNAPASPAPPEQPKPQDPPAK